jgi:hypothetical protein
MYANLLISGGSYTDINIHVLSGNYTESSSVTIGCGGQITLHFEANTYLIVSSAVEWIRLLANTKFSLVGSGRENCRVFLIGAGAVTKFMSVAGGCELEVKDIKVDCESSAGSTLLKVLSSGKATIDNSILSVSSVFGSNCYVVTNSGDLICRNAVLLSYSTYQSLIAPLIPGQAVNASDSWIIYEPASNGGNRLRLFQTQLISLGTSLAASHFILTTSSASTDSILLDNVYFHSTTRSVESLLNDNAAMPDNYYIGGTIISSSNIPNGAWNALPPTLAGVFDHWLVATVDPRN